MAQKVSFIVGVGIDTARYGHHVSFLDDEKRFATKPFHFEEGSDGYDKLQKALVAIQRKHPLVRFNIRVDAAGQYADNLIHWLHKLSLPTTISVGTPLKNKRYRQAHYDKRKADPVESLACARFAVVEKPTSMPPPQPAFSSLRNAVAALESNANHMTRLINQLHILLAACFPEFATLVSDLSKGYILALLAKYPTAKQLAQAEFDSIKEMTHLKEALAKKLYEASKASTAHATDEVHEFLVQAKIQEIVAAKSRKAALLKIMKKAWDSLPNGAHNRVHTIKGIGLQTAAALVAKMVDIERFNSDSAVIGYFGIFPEEVDASGTERDGQTPKKGTIIKMSAKGNDLVRRLLYTAAQTASKHNPAVKAVFARQAALGKHYNVVIGHCMAKLLRQVYAVWAMDVDYDPYYESKTEEKAEGLKVVEPQIQEVTSANSKIAPSTIPNKRPAINFAELKTQISIGQVLTHYGWTHRTQRGDQLRGACPIHGGLESDRSFAVHLKKNTYCCHSCHAKGNALDLLVSLSGQPLLEASWTWMEEHGIVPPLLNENKKEKLLSSV